jgi:hypothetical protein
MSNEIPTWCNTVQVLFLQGHSTCFGRKRPSSGVFNTSKAATGTCVIVAGKSSHLLIRAGRPDNSKVLVLYLWFTFRISEYHLQISPTYVTYKYHLRISPTNITYMSPINITYEYHLHVTYEYHLQISHTSITYMYHLQLSPTNITYKHHLHVPVAAVLVLNPPDEERLTPETCRVTLQK